jgi:hypothetical protein
VPQPLTRLQDVSAFIRIVSLAAIVNRQITDPEFVFASFQDSIVMMVIAVTTPQDCDRGGDASRQTAKGPNDQTD